MGEADDILGRLLGELEEPVTKQAQETSHSLPTTDFIKLAEELEKVADEMDAEEKKEAKTPCKEKECKVEKKASEFEFTDIEKVAYQHILSDALVDAATMIGEAKR